MQQYPQQYQQSGMMQYPQQYQQQPQQYQQAPPPAPKNNNFLIGLGIVLFAGLMYYIFVVNKSDTVPIPPVPDPKPDSSGAAKSTDSGSTAGGLGAAVFIPTTGPNPLPSPAPAPAPAPAPVVQQKTAKWMFYQGLDSGDNDIGPFGDTLPNMKAKCLSMPDCKGFNDNGWMKHTLRPKNEWYHWIDDPTKGFRVPVGRVATLPDGGVPEFD